MKIILKEFESVDSRWKGMERLEKKSGEENILLFTRVDNEAN